MPRFVLLPVGLLLCFVALAQPAAPVEVGVRPLREVALPDRGTAPANVIAPNDSRIAAEVTARVARVHAEVGSTVKVGQLLLELDAADYRLAQAQADAQVTAARARVALAQQRQQQALTLRKKQFVSDDAVLELKTGVQAAEADLEVARAQQAVAARNVEKCRIVAPFAGVVLERQAQVGATATPGTTLLRLVDLAPPEIEAQVQAIQADALPRASELTFDGQDRRYPVNLLRLSPVVDAAARTRVARLAFANRAAPRRQQRYAALDDAGRAAAARIAGQARTGAGRIRGGKRSRPLRVSAHRAGRPAVRRGAAARNPGGGGWPARLGRRPAGHRRRRSALTCASPAP